MLSISIPELIVILAVLASISIAAVVIGAAVVRILLRDRQPRHLP